MDRRREQQLRTRHAELVECHRQALIPAARELIEAASWSLQAPCVLIRTAAGPGALSLGVGSPTESSRAGVECLAVGQLGDQLEHLPSELDGFLRLRRGGLAHGAALAQCRREEGEAFEAAWRLSQESNALISHDNLVEFAALSQKGFGREPRELLVVVHWPDQVTAFLCACSRSGPFLL